MIQVTIDNEAIKELMVKAVEGKITGVLGGYNSPLDKHVKEAFDKESETIRATILEAVSTCVRAPTFKKSLIEALNHKLANLVINRCSGLVEKSFNELMQDAVLRNKLQAAVIKITEGK